MAPPLPRDAFPDAIVTGRLRMRRPERHEEALYARLTRDAYLTRAKPLDQAGARAFAAFMLEHWERYGFGFLVLDVVDGPAEARPIGHVGFRYSSCWPGRWSDDPAGIELGYSIVPAARGNGYVGEAARAALAAAFEAFDLPSIAAKCDHDNPRSAAVLLRCGMRELAPSTQHRHFEIARPQR